MPRLRPERALDALVVALAAAQLARVLIEPLHPELLLAVLAPAATLPLLARRRAPLAAPLAALAAYALAAPFAHGAVAEQLQYFLGIALCVWVVASENDRRRAAAGLAAAVAVAVAAVATDPAHHGFGDYAFALAVVACTFAAGLAFGRRARDAKRLERERDAALREERGRIARELHDLIAHGVSVMVVQSGAAARVLEDDPAAARDALEAIRRTGKDALVELRRLLGVLREEAPGDLAPQPSLERLEPLVDQVRAAGLPVELDVSGEPGTVPPGVEQAVYRILQEALTNALKHAGPARATVALRYEREAVDLRVTDDGPGTRNGDGTGHGLLGMRERALLYGGELEAGPRAAGGFEVHARLPL